GTGGGGRRGGGGRGPLRPPRARRGRGPACGLALPRKSTVRCACHGAPMFSRVRRFTRNTGLRGPRPPPPRLHPATGQPASVIRAWSSALVMVSAVASAALAASSSLTASSSFAPSTSASLERRGDLPGGGAVQDDVCERSGDFSDCSGQVDRRRGDGRGVRGGAAGRERVLAAGR